MDELNELLNDSCKINVETPINIYNLNKYKNNNEEYLSIIKDNNLKFEDDFEYTIKNFHVRLLDVIKCKKITNTFNPAEKINYTGSNIVNNSNLYFIKLFTSILISREYVDFEYNPNKGIAKFIFYLSENNNNIFDKEIEIIVDDKIIVDKNNKPIILDSPFLQDHLLLKAFIKMNLIFKVNEKNTNINSYCSLALGGTAYVLNFDSFEHLINSTHSIQEILNDSNNSNNSNNKLDFYEKTKQCNYISDTIIRAIQGLDIKPYNSYAETIFSLYEHNCLLGISFKDSLIYHIDSMRVDDYAKLYITFTNIFGENNIELSFETIQYGISKISVLIPLEIEKNSSNSNEDSDNNSNDESDDNSNDEYDDDSNNESDDNSNNESDDESDNDY